jgi:hypothetical protein
MEIAYIKRMLARNHCKRLLKIVCVSLVFMPARGFSQHPRVPIMGWSSWNNFHVNIDEKCSVSRPMP